MSIIDNIKEALTAGIESEKEVPGPIADFIKLAVEPVLKGSGLTDEALEQLDPEIATKIVTDMTEKIGTMIKELSMLHIDLLIGFVLILAKYVPGIKYDFDEDAKSESSNTDSTIVSDN